VLYTTLLLPPCTLWEYMFIIISAPIESPFFQAHYLCKFPVSLRGPNSFRSGIAQSDGIHTWVWELLRRHSESCGTVYSQMSVCDDPRPPIPAGIQNLIRLQTRLLWRWLVTRNPRLLAYVNRLQRSVTRRLNERRDDQGTAILILLKPEDQSLWMMTNGRRECTPL
jgi:hypothetical protein